MDKIIEKQKEEIIILKKEIELLHKNWKFDSDRFQQLKEEHKSLIKILEINKIKYII